MLFWICCCASRHDSTTAFESRVQGNPVGLFFEASPPPPLIAVPAALPPVEVKALLLAFGLAAVLLAHPQRERDILSVTLLKQKCC